MARVEFGGCGVEEVAIVGLADLPLRRQRRRLVESEDLTEQKGMRAADL